MSLCPFARDWCGRAWPFVRVICLAAAVAGEVMLGRKGARVMLEGKFTPLTGAGRQ